MGKGDVKRSGRFGRSRRRQRGGSGVSGARRGVEERGEVIDEGALVKALSQGQIAGAGLDVYENEPAVNPKLIKLSNVVLLPHMGSATIEGRINMGAVSYPPLALPPNRVVSCTVGAVSSEDSTCSTPHRH